MSRKSLRCAGFLSIPALRQDFAEEGWTAPEKPPLERLAQDTPPVSATEAKIRPSTAADGVCFDSPVISVGTRLSVGAMGPSGRSQPRGGANQMGCVTGLVSSQEDRTLRGKDLERTEPGMVDATGIEPVTPSMSTRCSPAELRVHKGGPFWGGREGRRYNGRLVPVQGLKAATGMPASGGHHPLHLSDDLAQVDRLGEDLRAGRR